MTWWQLPKGPANGWWQFEVAGVRGVLQHHSTRPSILQQLVALEYPEKPKVIHKALQYDSQLALIFARALLWTVPHSLPGEGEVDRAWEQYLSAWRPGKPHPQTWESNYRTAWEAVRNVSD